MLDDLKLASLPYNPLDWFWLAEDGRIYSSAKPGLVPASNRGFKAFKESGAAPTPWPRDEAGAESDAALDDVLRPYGLSLAGHLPASNRLAKADLWRRLSDGEAEALDAALATAPIRLRRIYEAASYLDTADADYPALEAGIVAAIGEERAAEVLAPNT